MISLMNDIDVNKLREQYKPGTRIRLTYMEGEDRMYNGLKGTVRMVDDAGQIHMKWDNGSSLAINTEYDIFEVIDDRQMISAILLEPGKMAKIVEIEDSLESLQNAVGGYIEEYMPFEDEVALIVNEEGKIDGLPLNRAVRNEDGKIIDIVAGKCLIVYAPIESESFLSLPKDLERKYFNEFRYPEKFRMTDKGFESIKYDPMVEDMNR